MTQIKGTNVLAPVVPFDTTDTHASHEARYGKGGYRSVADIAERDAIPQLRREAGMLVCVLTDGKVWRLGDNLTTWAEFKSGASSWDELSGKPSTFTPSSHTHTTSQITDFASAVAAASQATSDASLLTSGTLSAARLPATVVLTTDGRLSDARTPTAHSHAVSDVTGLQTALDAKQAAGSYAAASHTHTAGQVSGLATVATSGSYADLTNKPTIPAAVTSLPAASITGLATVATSGSYADLSGRPTLFSGAYADLTGVPGSFAPSAHNQAWSTITSTPTTLSGYGITDAVGSSDSRLSDARTPTSHTHALSSLTQSSATTGQVVTWNGSAWAAVAPFTSLATYATTASFPTSGASSSVLYLASDTSRLHQFVGGVYVEIGPVGGGSSGSGASSYGSNLLFG